MTLDGSVEDEDEVFNIGGINFVIQRSLNQTVGGVLVDYASETGVVVKTEAD